LIAEGCQIQIWDENVSLGQLIGSNRQFIKEYIPHIGTLLRDEIEDVLSQADVVVKATDAVSREKLTARLREGQSLVDIENVDYRLLKTPTDSLVTTA
jgi:GDP-mannose 6-dehydrogenase